jgi:peptide/nickel transport system substrate-binding protein
MVMGRFKAGLRQLLGAAAAMAMIGLASGPGPAQAESVLRIVPQADLKLLDPVFTTANITSNHGYMIYDTLFALDAKLEPKPEMIDTWSVSKDNLVWSFKLRPGLKFSDGSPVESKDVSPSIKRWAARMPAGQTMMGYVADIVAKDPQNFEIRLKRPFGAMLLALAGPENPLFIMRKQEATVDPNTQIKEYIGSGPFVFAKDEWTPGNKVVYKKNPLYVPRKDPPSGFAGAKIAKVDRVEWLYLPEPATAVQALANGEVDAIEIPSPDLLPVLRKNPDIVVKVIDHVGTQAIMRTNSLVPPFDNAKARQALLYLVGNQKDYLDGMVGDPKLEVPCWAVLVCGTPLATKAGVGDWPTLDPKAGIAKAKELFKEAGYKGEKVVLMDPTDQHLAHVMALVTADKLHRAGVNVDLQAMDWSTMTSRRPIKDSPEKNPGGWNIFFTWGGGLAMDSPLTNIGLPTPCNKSNWFGWPCDEKLEKLRLSFFDATTPQAQKHVVDEMQKRFYEVVPYIPPAQFLAPTAYRKNLKGVLDTARLVLWNIEKD